ncbi:urate hydroxylase PuuD [Azorhizobium doebereinerae]|uniref:urate hydroxylase PuuD n=1 Tax=Azorhizobium doebereinerae TaxID=281091 RepID=UPI0004278D82|nr:urate hydroxylase PuuD [Azorhizobium doebereinerae]
MEPILHEFGSLLLRWAHIVAGMAWIGASFYFMHLDAALRPTPDLPAGKGGEAWEVHGGGFYQVRKYLVAPAFLPDHLMWHKWESYTTWITGALLLVWTYYYQATLYLIDPSVLSLTPLTAFLIGAGGIAFGWIFYDLVCRSPLGRSDLKVGLVVFVFVVAMALFFQKVFSPRGAFIHIGALMATIMTANVFLIIIPNQRKVVAALKAGEAPDPKYGKIGKLRSSHNNYFTLPVIFLMMSNHYPITYSTPYAFVIVALALIGGAIIRVFYNKRHAGQGNWWWCWGVAFACLVLAVALCLTTTPAGRTALGLPALVGTAEAAPAPAAAVPGEVQDVVMGRCSMCHAAEPVYEGIATAPRGILLDTPEAMERNKPLILMQAALTHAMPPGNVTEITPAERAALKAWATAR